MVVIHPDPYVMTISSSLHDGLMGGVPSWAHKVRRPIPRSTLDNVGFGTGQKRRGRKVFKKILVPLDGSEQSERIGGWACGLARVINADIVLLGVIDPDDIEASGSRSGNVGISSIEAGNGPFDQPGADYTRGAAPGPIPSTPVIGLTAIAPGSGNAVTRSQLIDEAVERARRYLTAEADRVEAAGGKAVVEVAIGKPAEEIVGGAERLGTDAIAMATRRESTLARGVLGSVTDRVVHTTSLPLLALHPEGVSAFSGNSGAPPR